MAYNQGVGDGLENRPPHIDSDGGADDMTTPTSKRTTPAFYPHGIKLEWLRLVFDAGELVLAWELRRMRPLSFAVFMRLLPRLVSEGVEPDGLGHRLADTTPVGFRNAWSEFAHLLAQGDDGNWYLTRQPWLEVVIEPGPRESLEWLRRRLQEFWGEACVYCGNDDVPLDIEHIVPRKRGGRDEPGNLTLACARCNATKGQKTAAEFGHPHIHEMARGMRDAG